MLDATTLVSLCALLCLAPLAGCRSVPTVDGAGSPSATQGEDAGGEDPDDPGGKVAVARGQLIEPDPAQLDAGVPYLRYRIDVSDSPARGPADAPVTIVMFSDFECPFCSEAFTTVSQLQAEHPEDIRFVYKALPLLRSAASFEAALEAALVGYSAEAQGKFWEFHDLVFSGRGIASTTLATYVEQLGLDRERVAAELDSLVYAPALRRDLRTAKRLRLTSTPIFFINGRMLEGARPKHIFEHTIMQELDLAARLADEGVAASELYDYATQWGYTAIVYANERAELDEDTVYPVPIDDAPARGAADAPITIVAFSDFQCPFCAKGHAVMEELRARYGDQIRFVFKHFPLPGHPLGALASRVSFAAAEVGKFWEFHDALFAAGSRYDAQDLVDLALTLGVPRDALERAMTTEQNDAHINADVQLGMRLQITGTPAYFINGRPIVGTHPVIEFRLLIAEELARVEEARASGVPAAEIYEHLTGL